MHTKNTVNSVPLSVAAALEQLLGTTREPVGTEEISMAAPAGLAGRVLAAPVRLTADSPACDLSAMDGYAVRASEVAAGPRQVVGECRIGRPPLELAPGTALRIYTGCPLPTGADAVLRVEHGVCQDGAVRIADGITLTPGEDIWRQGENAERGEVVLDVGVQLTAASVSAAASVGAKRLLVYRRLRIVVITTGDELEYGEADEGALPPWRICDSNGPALAAMFGALPWGESVDRRHVVDTLDDLAEAIAGASAEADVVLLTGGVSKGAYDFVPKAVEQAGGQTLFHRISARPGHPTFAAVAGSVPIIGLPGNPVAVLCVGRRLVSAVLRNKAGFVDADPAVPRVTLREWRDKPLGFTWWRPVRCVAEGEAELVPMRGSGDTYGPAMTDGFIEVPPGYEGVGPFPFYSWRV